MTYYSNRQQSTDAGINSGHVHQALAYRALAGSALMAYGCVHGERVHPNGLVGAESKPRIDSHGSQLNLAVHVQTLPCSRRNVSKAARFNATRTTNRVYDEILAVKIPLVHYRELG